MDNPIYNLLVSKNHNIKVSGQDYVIKCLNPDHDDKNPSMRIDMHTGKFRCVSCGFSGNILKYYNVLTTYVSLKIANLSKLLDQAKNSITKLQFPPGAVSFRDSYRGISSKTLIKFEAFINTMDSDMDDRIIFPIRNVTGDITAFIGRHTLSNSGMRYKIYPSGAKLHCYPLVINRQLPYIILVEGIFDMLNLYDKGLDNVVCTFSATNLNKDIDKKLLPYKIQGTSLVFIMYDGDKAGRAATKEHKLALENNSYFVEVITLPDGSDPGSLTQEEVNYYKEMINEKSSHYR